MVNQLLWHKFLLTDFRYLELRECICIWHACTHDAERNPCNKKLQYFQLVIVSLEHAWSDSFDDCMEYCDTFLIFDFIDKLPLFGELSVRLLDLDPLDQSDLGIKANFIEGNLVEGNFVIAVVLQDEEIHSFLRFFCILLADLQIYIKFVFYFRNLLLLLLIKNYLLYLLDLHGHLYGLNDHPRNHLFQIHFSVINFHSVNTFLSTFLSKNTKLL